MINFKSDTLSEGQKKKLRDLPIEKKIEVLKALQFQTPSLLDYLIQTHEEAIEARRNARAYTKAVKTWEKLIEVLKIARSLFAIRSPFGKKETEEPPFPSFFATHGRKPIAGKDYDPEGSLCQDDYEFLSGTGRYSDEVKPS